jgi:hypothetical protein
MHGVTGCVMAGNEIERQGMVGFGGNFLPKEPYARRN